MTMIKARQRKTQVKSNIQQVEQVNNNNSINELTDSTTLYLSLLSGFYASLASVVGKLSTDPNTLKSIEIFCFTLNNYISGLIYESCKDLENSILSKILRILLFISMFTINGLMWTTYTKALSKSKASIKVIVINNATNMISTAIFGYLIFGETNQLMWWFGVSFVVCGTVLLNSDKGLK